MSEIFYWQSGEVLDFENGTSDVMPENTVVNLATRIGITGTRIAVGAKGSVHVVGVFGIPKVDTEVYTQGQALFYDGTAELITSTDTGLPAGYAAMPVDAGSDIAYVKLVG
jgi:Uncharacterized conserved protein (DUF2190).